MAKQIDIDVSGSGEVVLSEDQVSGRYINLYGELSGSVTVTLPDTGSRSWVVFNRTGGKHPLLVAVGDQKGVFLNPGYMANMKTAARKDAEKPPSDGGGVFDEIASQLEAEAGVDNSKGMTPLRVAQAIESLGSGADISLTPNRFKTLKFNAAPAIMEFGVEIGDGVDPIVLTGGMSAEQIKSAIEASDDMDGFTATVVGLTLAEAGADGVGLHSGKFVVALSGDAPFPAWGAVQNSEVQSFVVVEGDSSNYTLNGGANFEMGISAADLQVNQRALTGDYTDVAVAGSSSGAEGEAYDVSATGVGDWEGRYTRTGNTISGAPEYSAGAGKFLFRLSDGKWLLSTVSNGITGSNYETPEGGGLTPPLTGWGSGGLSPGGAPFPVLTYVPPVDDPFANFNSYFPFAAGDVANPSATGTDASVSTIYQGSNDSALVTAVEATIDDLLIAGLISPETSG